MLQIEGVRRTYQLGDSEIRAVDGVDLTIEEGSAVAILGPSGSGKSTLLQLLGALDTPDDGRVVVGGQAIGSLSPVERARYRNRNVGFVFQSFYLQASRTALENVEVPLVVAGLPAARRRELARQMLEAVGLGDRLDHRPTELSGGQQQRVSIARALVTRPRLLLADEPTGNLDTRTGGEIMDLFLRLASEQGLTLVLVTHDPELARRADRVVRMRDGRIESDEPTGVERQRPEAVRQELPAPAGRAARAADLVAGVLLGLRRQRLRTALTATGIGVGGFAIALMVGLGLGLHDFIVTQAEAVNDPLSLRVVNSSFSWDDVFGDRIEWMTRAPVPLEEKTLERLGTLRAGYEPFTEEQVETLRSIEGVASVRPRIYVVVDGVRLVDAAAEAGPAGEVEGPPERFPETYYLSYCLVRGAGTPFRLSAGSNLTSDDPRGVILSWQFYQAWGLDGPDDLVGREIEMLFPSLGQYSEWNWARPDDVEARYRSYRARVVGVTKKSILACGIYLTPAFGEEVATFQFGRGAGRGPGGGEQDVFASALQILELVRLLDEPSLEAALTGGTDAERELWATLSRLRDLQNRPPGDGPGNGDGDGADPLRFLLELGRVRQQMKDPDLQASLTAGPGPKRRLAQLVEGLLGALPGGEAEEENGPQYGSVLRVRVRSVDEVARVQAEIEEKGFRVRSLEEDLEAVGRIFAVIDAFLSSFGLIALLVAAIGIANTLLMTVLERTQEIGLLKAVGATEGRIRGHFALEAAGIGLFGGILGILTAVAIGHWINVQGIGLIVDEWAGFPFFQSPAWLVAATLAFCTTVGLAAGLYPAHRAARLDPIRALRSE